MTTQELQSRLREQPELVQEWVDAVLLPNGGGALYVSHVAEDCERIGNIHVYIWDRSDMGNPDSVRRSALMLMERLEIDRFLVEIDERNRLAIALAKKVGFNEIGRVRNRKDRFGGIRQMVLLDALPGDLDYVCH